ncbi:TPA: host cell division inhibitor Icd-like protein [Citrobacter freundii]|nr:host cell division inhibitor Icd-like protein [Citrobacter freundii]
MAKNKHTENHRQFTWRFLALDANSEIMIQIVAESELAARQQVPDWRGSIFVARLPVMEVAHVC